MYVSLSISGHDIKVLSLQGKRVKKWGGLVLKDGLVKDGLVREPEAVGEAIADLFRSTGLPRERVVVSLAGMPFTYRFLNLPRLKPSLREEAILRAAGKEMSLPLNDLYLVWQALPGTGDEQGFFVLGVPKNPVDTLLQALHVARVAPYLVDLRPLALARAAARSEAIAVNLDADCFDIVFIVGGLPRVVHTVSPRSREATLQDNIRQVVDELGKMTAFYQGGRPDASLSATTPLLLAGDITGEATAGALLQAEIEYPVEPLLPPVDSPPGFPAASYAVSVGLALKGAPPPVTSKGQAGHFHDLDVNILAGKRRNERVRRRPAVNIPLVIVLAVAIIVLFPLYQARAQLAAENSARQVELNDLNRQLDLAGLAAAEDARTEETIRAVSANISAIEAAGRDLLGGRGEFSADLAAVTLVLPAEAVLTSFEADAVRVTVGGQASSVFTATDYAATLAATGRFSDVRISRLDEVGPIPGSDNTSLAASLPIVFEVVLAR